MTRLSLRGLLIAALALLTLAGCGSDDSGDSTGSSTSAVASTAAAPTETETTAASAFPVTVEHKFGETTVEKEPERIAVVGLTEQDVVLALGKKPIATTEWYGEQPYAVWPWAQEALGDAKPEVLSDDDGFQFERIAALKPDLIVGTNAGMEKGDWEKLSALAPTLPAVKDSPDYFSPWDQQVELIATAMGQEEQGQQLVQDVKDKYAQLAEEHPEFAGKTATFSQNGFYDGLIYVYPDGVNTEFLTYLGFEMNPEITKLAKKPGEQVAISAERMPVMDADAVVFATESPKDIKALEKVPTFTQLDAVAENRAVFTDPTLAGAIYFMTPLSLDYVAEHLTPQLADAVAGKAPREIVEPGG